MSFIDEKLLEFKNNLEMSIIEGGVKGKTSIIRSSGLINLIHDAVKKEFIEKGVNPENIFPAFNATKPELKIAGFLKQKDQDICIVPNNIKKIIENKKKLSNMEQKVGETWQGKVITNDTNLNILTWEKVDE